MVLFILTDKPDKALDKSIKSPVDRATSLLDNLKSSLIPILSTKRSLTVTYEKSEEKDGEWCKELGTRMTLQGHILLGGRGDS